MWIILLRQKGAALPSVLGVTAMLGLMAASFVQTTRHSNLATRYSVQNIHLSHMADAASERAIADLLTDNPQLAQDGEPYAFNFENHTINVRIWDEKGKFDINVVSPRALENLIDLVSLENNLDTDIGAVVEAINEYRLERRRENETPFRSVYDLMQIPLFSEALFEALSPYLTVSSYTPRINVLKADEIILRALPGISEADVQSALSAKQRGEAVPIPSAAPWVTTATGPFYRIYSEVVLASGQRNASDITVWIREGQNPVVVASRPVY